MKRVLITGIRGFVGGYLRPHYADVDVMGIDRKDGFDICDPRLADSIARFDPHIAFHLAAEHFVPWCREHPNETRSVNVDGTRNLLAALRDCGSLRSVVLASSAAVYGFGDEPFRETALRHPTDVYGYSKMEAEDLLLEFSVGRTKVSCVAARLSNVVGAGDNNPHLLPVIMTGSAFTLGNLWPRRDYIYAGDVAQALVGLALWPEPGYHVYNVSTGQGTTVTELIDVVDRVRGYASDYGTKQGRDDDGHLVLDPTQMRKAWGWEAKTTLEEVVQHWN